MSASSYRPAVRSAALCRLIGTMADVPTADLADRYGARVQVLDLPFRSFGGRRRFFGPARTLRCHADLELVRQLLSDPGTGSVLVVDGGGDPGGALLGDRLATTAHGQGWSGVVVHGAVRDTAQLETIELGIAATRTTPRRGTTTGRGEVDVPLLLGGARVRPGDVVVADRDGVIVIDPNGTDPNGTDPTGSR